MVFQSAEQREFNHTSDLRVVTTKFILSTDVKGIETWNRGTLGTIATRIGEFNFRLEKENEIEYDWYYFANPEPKHTSSHQYCF